MMTGQGKRGAYLAFVLVVSTLALVISASLLRNPVPFVAAPGERRALVAFAYDIVCIAGILAALFPVACSRALNVGGTFAEAPEGLGIRATEFLGIRIVHGHHPPGLEVSKHELFLGKRSYCAACYGLLTGAVLSLATTSAFAASGWSGWTGSWTAHLLYYGGVAAVVTGLFPALMLRVGAKARFVLAVMFVVGTGLMLLATDLLTADLMADLFVVLLVVFWLLSRISLSHRSWPLE